MTAEELFALPENDRIDRRLIRGGLVERPYPLRSPAHAGVVATLSHLLINWRRSSEGIGWSVYGYGCPYRLVRKPDTLLYFDSSIYPISKEALSPRAAFIDGIPTLAIEVVDIQQRNGERGTIVLVN
jgi:hypothetical protein